MYDIMMDTQVAGRDSSSVRRVDCVFLKATCVTVTMTVVTTQMKSTAEVSIRPMIQFLSVLFSTYAPKLNKLLMGSDAQLSSNTTWRMPVGLKRGDLMPNGLVVIQTPRDLVFGFWGGSIGYRGTFPRAPLKPDYDYDRLYLL